MCGIVGYVGKRDAQPLIISGLEKLEYRGYDSAGIAVLEADEVRTTRVEGKLAVLKQRLDVQTRNGSSPIGIGHTRWATHGRPSDDNAHPHRAGRVSLVHNGIIENYVALRTDLQKRGAVFTSETDTEIAAHLLNSFLEAGEDPFQALKDACAELIGSFAFLAFDSQHTDRLLVAKNATPLIIGQGKDEMFVASDIPAVLEHTRDIIILEDGDVAEVRVDAIVIESAAGPVVRESQKITWDPVTAQKGGYKHFMLKEIHEQGPVVAETIRGRLDMEQQCVAIPEIGLSLDQLNQIERVVMVACGTAWHACLVAKFYFEQLTGIACEVDYASEFRYRKPVLTDNTLVIVVSQSGETADTLAALELANESSHTLAICNVLGSSIARKAHNVVYTYAGPEISVASTKAFTTQLTLLHLLAVHIGVVRGVLSSQLQSELVKQIIHLPSALDEALQIESGVRAAAKHFSRAEGFLFISRGICYPIALEGALKLKEISYIHAEGYPAGELKHGPIALIDEHMPVIALVQNSDIYHKTVSNLKEVESRGGQLVIVTDQAPDQEMRDLATVVIRVPHISEVLSPILFSIPVQLFAYYVAVFNGTDVDQPRNLAKSVTVE